MLMSALYRSHAMLGRESSAEQALLKHARAKNHSSSVSGYLHREEDVYYQWIEGPVQTIEALLVKLQGDPRHACFSLLNKQVIAQRQFPSWTMGYSSADKGTLLEWAVRNDLSLRVFDPAKMVAFFRDQISQGEAGDRPMA